MTRVLLVGNVPLPRVQSPMEVRRVNTLQEAVEVAQDGFKPHVVVGAENWAPLSGIIPRAHVVRTVDEALELVTRREEALSMIQEGIQICDRAIRYCTS